MKRILYAILVLGIMAFPVTASAVEYDLVKAFGIMTGYENGDFGGEDFLTRAQFAKIAVTIIDKDFVAVSYVSPYSDVAYTHWAAAYIAYASDLGLLSGYPDGTFLPEKTVTYEESAKVLLYLMGYKADGSGDWAGIQIDTARRIGIFNGVNPVIGKGLTRFDAAKMVENSFLIKPKNDSRYYIETLGYRYFQNAVIITDKTISGDKALTSVGTYNKSGRIKEQDILTSGDLIIDENDNIIAYFPKKQVIESYVIKTILGDKIATYNTVEQIEIKDDTRAYIGERQTSYQMLKNELETGDRILLYKDATGKTEYMSMDKNVIRGPITNIGTSVISEFNITTDVSVMRDGVKSDMAGINDYDVCYYIEEAATVLVYSKKKTGVYENALPNKDNPSKILLSGETFEVGNIEAFNKLSASGGLRYGDTITLLFDKDGKIADVTTPDHFAAQTTGYLIKTGFMEQVNENSERQYRYYARLAATDGSEISYVTDKDYDSLKGRMVAISFSNGRAALSSVSASRGLSGKFDWAGRTIGSEKIADDIKIMDAAKYENYRMGKYAFVFPQRIDAATIAENNILYFEKNNSGEISHLVLTGVTNDMYRFGLITKATNRAAGIYISGEYELLLGGEKNKILTTSVTFPVFAGQPALFDFEEGQIKNIRPLTRLNEETKGVDAYYLYTDAGKHRLGENVYIYKKIASSGYDYEVISLGEAIDQGYNLTAYYDSLGNSGGRIRVLMVNG